MKIKLAFKQFYFKPFLMLIKEALLITNASFTT
jgi:hypothetical protein